MRRTPGYYGAERQYITSLKHSWFIPHEEVRAPKSGSSSQDNGFGEIVRIARQFYETGNHAFAEGNNESALHFYNKGLEYIEIYKCPLNEWLLENKAHVCNLLGSYQTAIDCLSTIKNVYRSYDGLDWKEMGIAYKGLKNYKQALACFEQATHFEDTCDEATQYIAEIREILRPQPITKFNPKHQEAKMAKKLFLAANPSLPWISKGQVYLTRNDCEQARSSFEEALALDPTNSIAAKGIEAAAKMREEFEKLCGEGNAYAEDGNQLAALQYYNQVLDINRNYIPALYRKAYYLNELGRFKEALDCCVRILSLDYNNKLAWRLKGLALSGVEQYYDAISCFDAALRIDPRDTKALVGKGDALRRIGRSDHRVVTIMIYKKALYIDNQLEDAKQGLAEVLGQYEQGYSSPDQKFESILTLSPESINDKLQIDRSTLIASVYDDHITIYWSTDGAYINNCAILTKEDSKKIINLLPNTGETVCDRHLIDAISSVVIKTYPEKIKKYKIIDLTSQAKQFYYAGNMHAVIKCYEEALAIQKNDPNLWCEKALYLNQMGNYDDAITCCEQALLIDKKWEIVLTQKNNAINQKHQFNSARKRIITEVKKYQSELDENIKNATFGPFTLFYNMDLYSEKKFMATNSITELENSHTLLEITSVLNKYIAKDQELCKRFDIELNTFSNLVMKNAQQEVSDALALSKPKVNSLRPGYDTW